MAGEMSDVERYLESEGMDPSILPDSLKTRLEIIDKAIRQRVAAAERACQELKGSRVSILGIANDTGIPRKSIYNNPLLRGYIEHGEKLHGNLTVIKSSELSNLRQRCDRMESQIKKMAIRDIDIENLKYENESLRREVAARDKRIGRLESEIDRLRREAQATARDEPAQGARIIELDRLL